MLLNRPYFLLFLAPLIWGGHVVVAKVATVEVAPMTLTLLRWTVALAVIIPFEALPVLICSTIRH